MWVCVFFFLGRSGMAESLKKSEEDEEIQEVDEKSQAQVISMEKKTLAWVMC